MEDQSAVEPPLTIRPFDGSLAVAEGLLAVERATFDESPYTAAEVQAMLVEGPQRAWLAVQRERIVGFAIGFQVSGLHGSWWEVDLLAVHPEWRGRRLGQRLIESTLAYGAGLTRKARALVADDNRASEQTFLRAGFRLSPGARELFIFRPGKTTHRRRTRRANLVREAFGRSEVIEYLTSCSAQTVPAAASSDPWGSMGGPAGPGQEPTLLVMEGGPGRGEPSQTAGYAELIEVQTLLYRGIWIESLLADSFGAREALVERAVDRACEAGLDEVGAVVHEQDWAMQRALRQAGFRSLGGFRWLVAQMPGGSALA